MPKDSVIVPQGLTNPQIAAALMAHFFDRGMNNDCGSLILGYRDQSEEGSAYTMGRVNLDVTNGKHDVELNIGDAVGKEEVFRVTY